MISDLDLDPRRGLPSASGFGRLALCPGSFRMEKACPDESGDAAKEGTLLHGFMEAALRTGEIPAEADAEQRQLCEDALSILGKTQRTISDSPFELVSAEERRFISDWIEGGEYSGQWDALFRVQDETGRFLFVLDWKFGRVEVDAAEANRQLEALVPLVADKMDEAGEEYDGIYAAIIQPRVSVKASLAFYYKADAELARARALEVARNAMEEDAPLNPSDKACAYCRAKAVCPAACGLVRQSTEIAKEPHVWEAYQPDEKIKALRLAKLAKKWAAAVEVNFERDVQAGLIPGFEMGPGKKAFTVTDPAGAFAALNACLPGVSAEAFTACCKVNISDLDKLVHGLRKEADAKATLKDSKAWLREVLLSYGEEKTSKGTVKEVET